MKSYKLNTNINNNQRSGWTTIDTEGMYKGQSTKSYKKNFK